MATNQEVNKELELIFDAISPYSEGVSLRKLRSIAGIDLEVRTLQRRLEKLRDRGKIIILGNTKAVIYKPVVWLAREASEYGIQRNTGGISEILLSPEAQEVKELVERQVSHRTPVGYHSDFLLSYRPNVDSYLSADERRRLTDIGRTQASSQAAGTYAKSVLERLMIDLSWNSSRLEGNTYNLLDTQYLISQGRVSDHKAAADAQMILNHKEAIEFIVQGDDEIGFNSYTVTNLHAMLSDNLLPDPASSGRLRAFAVGVTNSVFTPLAIPQLVDDMFRKLIAKADAIENPFEQAFFVMVHLSYLQPFEDVNKRVSRLLANIPLNRHNLSPLAFVDVPADLYIKGLLGVYELNRVELLKEVFIWSYERSALRYAAIRQTLGDPDIDSTRLSSRVIPAHL